MKDVLKKGLKIYYLLLIANILSFFLVISFNVISVVAFTEEIGYTAYGTMEGSEEQTELYTHYFADGDDTQKQGYEDAGYTVTTASIRSNPSRTINIVMKSVSGVFCLLMVAMLIYGEMWKNGDKDRTQVKYKGMKEKINKGFIVGLIATVPQFLFILVLTVLKSTAAKSFPMLIFAILNTYLYDFIYLIAGDVTLFGDLAFWQILIYLLFLVIVPIVCGVAYILGYKEFSIGEKLVYKKTDKK